MSPVATDQSAKRWIAWVLRRPSVFLIGVCVAVAVGWPAYAIGSSPEAPQGSEVVAKRTAFSKTWRLPNGELLTRISGTPIHYLSHDGRYRDLDLDFRTSRGSLDASIGEVGVRLSDDGKSVELADGAHSLSLELNGQESDPEVDANVATFSKVLPGIDRRLTVIDSGVKEELILEGPESSREYTYRLALGEGLAPQVAPDGSILISGNGKRVFRIPPVTLYEFDRPGEFTTLDNAYGLEELGGGEWALTVQADGPWMQASERSWPVVVDPTIVVERVDADTGFKACLNPMPNGTGSRVCFPPFFQGDMQVGWGQGQPYMTNLIFEGLAIPTTLANRVVTDVKLKVHHKYSWGRPGTAASMPPAPNITGSPHPLPGIESQQLEVVPAASPAPSDYNWPLGSAVIDRETVPAGESVAFDVTGEVRAWVENMADSSQGHPQRTIGLRPVGSPGNGIDSSGCKIYLETAACQGHISQFAGTGDPDPDKQPHLDIYSAPPAPVGSGITSPMTGEFTSRFVDLKAVASSPNVDTVRFEYVAGDEREWQAIPPEALHAKTDTTPLGSVDIPIELVDGGADVGLIWDLQKTPGGEVDGPVHVRAILETSGGPGGGVTSEVEFRLDRRNQATSSVASVGPAEVDLLTGDLSITETDAQISAFLNDLEFTRTYHSRGVTPRNTDMFGPGWSANVSADEGGLEYRSIYSFKHVTGTHVQEWIAGQTAADQGAYDSTDFENEPAWEISRFDKADYAVVELDDGSRFTFQKDGGDWVPEDAFTGFDLTLGSGKFTLVDDEGNSTLFEPDVTGSPRFLPSSYTTAGSNKSTTFEYQVLLGQKLLSRVIAPRVGSGNCSTPSTWPDDCRALEISRSWMIRNGKLILRVTSLSLRAWDPSGERSGSSHQIAAYTYDDDGRLKTVSDPRVSGGLPTSYAYDSKDRLTSITPPGEKPWTFGYQQASGDDSEARVRTVSRETPAGPVATSTIVYDVPMSGSSAPHGMAYDELAEWGQTDLPRTATAVFPPDSVPSGSGLPTDWDWATTYYISTVGQIVNAADDQGNISTTEHDLFGNVVRELSPVNRELALASPGSSAAASFKLDSQFEYAANGVDLITELQPERDVRRPNGQLIKARPRTAYSYDVGKPSSFDEDLHLVTEVRSGALRSSDNAVIDEQVTINAYGNSTTTRGWEVGEPISVKVGSGAEQETTQFTYHAQFPLLTEERRPRSDGSDAQTFKHHYYGIGTQPAWCTSGGTLAVKLAAASGAPCTTFPAGTAASPGPLPMEYIRYSLYWDAREISESNSIGSMPNPPIRKTTISRDAIGRETSRAVSSAYGQSVPMTSVVYDSATGRQTAVHSLTWPIKSVVRTFDNNGRPSTYTDASGNTTEYTYSHSGRLIQTEDNFGETEYGYDTRGLVVEVDDSTLSAPILAARDADGQLFRQEVPGGIELEIQHDESGSEAGLQWSLADGCSVNCELVEHQVERDAQGRVATSITPTGSESFTYDTVGRLKQSDLQQGNVCVRTEYEFDKSSNRTGMKVRTSGPGGACGTGAQVTKSYTYDTADRKTGTGYTYDVLGRTSTVPASDSPFGQASSLNYAQDDLVTKITSGSDVQDLTYDPLRRLLTEQTKIGSNPAVTSQLYYGSDEDQPTASLSSAGWERYVADTDGMMLAVSNAGGASLQMRDLLGDVVATIDVGATVPTTTVDYSIYGERRGTTGTIPNDGLNLGWKGGYGKNTAFTPGGFIHMGARVYNPTSGRFLQLDPVVNGSANPYDYANQDPLNQMDLNGLCPVFTSGSLVKFIASIRKSYIHIGICKSAFVKIKRIMHSAGLSAASAFASGLICSRIKKVPKMGRKCAIAVGTMVNLLSDGSSSLARKRQCLVATVSKEIQFRTWLKVPIPVPVYGLKVRFTNERGLCR